MNTGTTKMETAADKKPKQKVVANSRAMRETVAAGMQAALRSEPILIHGNSGSGKSFLARTIHDQSCPYGPFVSVACEALTPDVLHSTFYGDKSTNSLGVFEMAEEGTLLLTGIENLSPLAQEHLKQAISTGRYTNHLLDRRAFGCRVMTTGNLTELKRIVESGVFDSALYKDMSSISIRMPDLADRKEDIPALSVYILDELATRERIERPSVPYHYMDLLIKVPWHDNVRQLRNHLESVMVLSNGQFDPEIILEHFVTEESPATIKGAFQALWRKVFGENARTAAVRNTA
jgi:two-component system response regulator GlrR